MSKKTTIKIRNPLGRKVTFDMTNHLEGDTIIFDHIFTDQGSHKTKQDHDIIEDACKEMFPKAFGFTHSESYDSYSKRTRVSSQLVTDSTGFQYYHLPNVNMLSDEESPWSSGNLMAFTEEDSQAMYQLVTNGLVDAIICDKNGDEKIYRLIKGINCHDTHNHARKELIKMFNSLKLVWEIKIDGERVLDNKGHQIVFESYNEAREYAKIAALYTYSCLMPANVIYESTDLFDNWFNDNILAAGKICKGLKDIVVPTNLSQDFVDFLKGDIKYCVESQTPLRIPELYEEYKITITSRLIPNNGITL